MRIYTWTLERDSGNVVIAAAGRNEEDARQMALADLETEYLYLGVSEADFPPAETSFSFSEFVLIVDNTQF